MQQSGVYRRQTACALIVVSGELVALSSLAQHRCRSTTMPLRSLPGGQNGDIRCSAVGIGMLLEQPYFNLAHPFLCRELGVLAFHCAQSASETLRVGLLTPCSKYRLCNRYGQRQPFFYIIPSAKSLNLARGFCKTPFGRLVGLENG